MSRLSAAQLSDGYDLSLSLSLREDKNLSMALALLLAIEKLYIPRQQRTIRTLPEFAWTAAPFKYFAKRAGGRQPIVSSRRANPGRVFRRLSTSAPAAREISQRSLRLLTITAPT
jgi:hypothetical protein